MPAPTTQNEINNKLVVLNLKEIGMIYGKRLRLRAAEREDLPRFVAWLNDPEVRQFLLINQPLSMAEEERWFDSMLNRPSAEHVRVIEIAQAGGSGDHAADVSDIQRGDGISWKPIGNVALENIDWVNRSAEIGIFIGEKSCWNQGYGREAMSVMLRHAFETINLNRVYLYVYAYNPRAIRSYERAGFKLEGRLREGRYHEGRYHDVLLMAVLRSEWQSDGFSENQGE